MKCKILKDIDERIRNGEDPDLAIPWSLPDGIDNESYKELLYYTINHSRIPNRVETCIILLEDIENVSRTDSDISRQ